MNLFEARRQECWICKLLERTKSMWKFVTEIEDSHLNFRESFVHNDNQLDVSRYHAEATSLFWILDFISSRRRAYRAFPKCRPLRRPRRPRGPNHSIITTPASKFWTPPKRVLKVRHRGRDSIWQLRKGIGSPRTYCSGIQRFQWIDCNFEYRARSVRSINVWGLVLLGMGMHIGFDVFICSSRIAVKDSGI